MSKRKPDPKIVKDNAQHVLQEHVERQRVELFQAQAIVQTVVAAMRPGDWPRGQPGFPYALEVVNTMIEHVTEQLDSAILFDLPGAEPEVHP